MMLLTMTRFGKPNAVGRRELFLEHRGFAPGNPQRRNRQTDPSRLCGRRL